MILGFKALKGYMPFTSNLKESGLIDLIVRLLTYYLTLSDNDASGNVPDPRHHPSRIHENVHGAQLDADRSSQSSRIKFAARRPPPHDDVEGF